MNISVVFLIFVIIKLAKYYRNNSSVMKNLLTWDTTETINELSPKRRAKSPLIEEKTSPYLADNRRGVQKNNLRR